MDFSKRIESTASAVLADLLSSEMDKAIAAKAKAEYETTRGSGEGDVAAKRIGAGYIGTACSRELGFRFHKFPKEDRPSAVSPGELQRHAEAGHWTEAKTAGWLHLVGLDVETFVRDKETGLPVMDMWGKPKQIGWKAGRNPETGKYRLAGEVDGVIVGVRNPVFTGLIKMPCIWESKKATDKKFKKFVKDKVKGADPRYYGQLQSNMAYMNVEQTLFSMLNLDTMKYHWELIPFDIAHAQDLSDRAVKVFQSESPTELPRLCRSDDDFNGKYCDYHDQCWKGLVLKAPEVPPVSNGVAFPNTGPASPPLSKPPLFNPNWKV